MGFGGERPIGWREVRTKKEGFKENVIIAIRKKERKKERKEAGQQVLWEAEEIRNQIIAANTIHTG